MNAFGGPCSSVEQRGLAVVMPLLSQHAHDGRMVMLSKGPLARHLQEQIGDAIVNCTPKAFYSVEIKTEQRHTGNLFLETWSNRNLDSRRNHAELGSNRGWLDKLRLQGWAYGHEGVAGHIHKYPEKRQNKYSQLNDTWGCCVPIADLQKALHVHHVRPQQPGLFDDIYAPMRDCAPALTLVDNSPPEPVDK